MPLNSSSKLRNIGLNLSSRLFTRSFNLRKIPNVTSAVVALSADTSLAVFTVDGTPVTDAQTINLINGTVNITLVATPTHADATVENIVGGSSLVTGDNALSFTVRAQNGSTTRNYTQNLHVLTEGTAEITTMDFTGLDYLSYTTGNEGKYMLIWAADGLHCLWVRVDGIETQPGGEGASLFNRVDIALLDTANAIAAAHATAAQASGSWSASASGPVATLTDTAIGPRTDASGGFPDPIIAVTQQGANPV